MQIWKWEKEIAERLVMRDSPDLCARLLLRHAGEWNEIEYLLALREELSEEVRQKLLPLVERCEAGEPIAYILGKREFFSHEFIVSPDTLVPRPETELLVEIALARLSDRSLTFIDAGCGTGCVGISVALEKPQWSGILVDNSSAALKISAENCKKLYCPMPLLHADMACLPLKDNSIDLILSNPPYIDPAKRNEIMSMVLAYEPHSALFSEQGGLGHILSLCREAARILRPGGMIVFEHAYDQVSQCRKILSDAGFIGVEDFQDLAGLSRCSSGIKK